MPPVPPPHRTRGFLALTTPEQWRDLLQHGKRRPVERGTRLLDQGGPSRLVYALEHGRARVVYTEHNGDEVLVAVRGPGDLVGEYAQRDRSKHMASVWTLEQCVVTVFTADGFEGGIRRHDLGEPLQRYMLGKARQVGKRVWRVAHLRVEQRMAKLFLEIIEAGVDAEVHTVPLSQNQIAASLGVSLSSVAHLLGAWRRIGLVETRAFEIEVLDLPALTRRAATR
ncbi:Crp/Fnr family transcriptional regulator [Glycomyces sp. TRM65418]|uniref:Crp/Fnr family transcriptional regulator n=1 Tax=Glycomyces sp. TRM65418 TaxID=2867006 RepID=UPI001CE666BD|nr:Crp/Fnr family transcriptional regulator [Glycomyces sp. TRM65418]MCC3765263.1 Crp/Fnr family transcriptional regulator [Glycomyces sp. TRM65418]QZD54884.1 Crp/Fnr family transcriptional regulator [Glycomyces sp. TRM65418]